MGHRASFVFGIGVVVLASCGGDNGTPIDSGVDSGDTVDAVADSTTDSTVSCTDDEECDDGVFCNGVETCESGTCTPATEPACGELACNESEDACITDCDLNGDADNDGHDAVACGGDDCNDTSPLVYLGAEERPGNGIDEDCDGMELCYADADDDGFRTDDTNVSSDLECTGVGEASLEAPGGDCDDTDDATYPGAEEIVADGVDQSCDGFEACFADIDEDGFRPNDASVVPSEDLDCFDPGEADGTISTGDCDDSDALRNPAVAEVVGDGVDQNCDGAELCYVDADGDGYRPGDGSSTVASADLACDGAGEADHLAPINDCADDADDQNPGALERCNGIDDNCDTRIDERFGVRPFPPGGFGWFPITRSCGTSEGRCEPGYERCIDATWEGTCTGEIAPRTELCDTTDDDCDGTVDEGCACVGGSTRACGSTTGVCTEGTQTCTVSGVWAACVGGVTPTEESCNGVDDDCNGETDEEGATGCTDYFIDRDDDGFGDRSEEPRCLCAPDGEHSVEDGEWQTDCDDDDPEINPGAAERCDGVDWNCNGAPREVGAMGCTNYYRDFDRDAYGAAGAACLCAPNAVWRTTVGGDCCDRDARAHPGATTYQTLPTHCGGYDFNCNGTRELRYTEFFGCPGLCGPDDTDHGWMSSPDIGAPDCGLGGFWNELCFPQPIPPFCFQAQSFRFQQCR